VTDHPWTVDGNASYLNGALGIVLHNFFTL